MATKKHTGLELLEAMRDGIKTRKTINVRRALFTVRPLSITEHREITSEVARILMSAEPSDQTKVTEEVLFAQMTLMRATTSDFGKQDSPLTQAILDQMTVGETMTIFREYNRFVESIDPSIEEMPPEKLQALIDELRETIKKNPSRLTELSGSELRDVCKHLFRTWEPSPAGK